MASYFPEGECYFIRSSLRYANEWTAENQQQFYSHVLIEYYWNGWRATGNDIQNHRHPRSAMHSGTGAGISNRTVYGDWGSFSVGESIGNTPGSMLTLHRYNNSLNWNECRDLFNGGPKKYILRPLAIRHKDTQWLWIDATIPLRAIYFPVCQTTDEAFPQFCTYVVIDFKARDRLTVFNSTGGDNGSNMTISVDREQGLGRHDDVTWGFRIPDIITYLSIPHKLRNPAHGLFSTARPADALFYRASANRTWHAPGLPEHVFFQYNFHRQIDLADVISATFAVEVGWRPYQYSSFILNLVLHVAQLGLSFIPGAGPLLSVAFGMGVQLLQDPDSFRAENVLDLGAAILETLINSSSKGSRYIAPDFLPQGTYRPIATSTLTEEEREQRKKLGDEVNQRLTEVLQNKVGAIEMGSPEGGVVLRRLSEVRDPEVSEITRREGEHESVDTQTISVQVAPGGQRVAEAIIRFK